jgi:hypothetical protein
VTQSRIVVLDDSFERRHLGSGVSCWKALVK